MTKPPAHPSLLARLALFAPVETLMCVVTMVGAMYGLWSYLHYEDGPLAAQVMPFAYAFGPWPFLFAMVMGLVVGAMALHKARI